ncbi:MAG: hypothetical protein M0Q27_03385 [Candidatus Colwellbacteria bacterium]|nr:hypothetical protein [Candidatus Colwellbacteria bacterium]
MFGQKKKATQTLDITELSDKLTATVVHEARTGLENKLNDFFAQYRSIPALESRIRDLQKERDVLERDLGILKDREQIEEEKLAHRIRLLEEKMEVQYQKKQLENERHFIQKESALTQTFHAKQLKSMDEFRREIRDLLSQILTLLPNVNVRLSDHRGPTRKEEK